MLSRLTYGPRPGDVARVQRMGLEAWIDEQLRPERIPDAAMQARLASFETLGLDVETLAASTSRPSSNGGSGSASEADTAGTPATGNGAGDAASEMTMRDRMRTLAASPAQQKDRQVLVELESARILRAAYSERQLEEVLVDFWFNHFNVFAGKGPTRAYVTAFERDAIRPYVLGNFRQMLEAVASSPAMLFYLDNWQNSDGGAPQMAQRAQTPQTPQTPQMTQAPQMPQMAQRAQRAQRGRQGQGRRRPSGPGAAAPGGQARPRMTRGLNENYARELLELHTLGVDGGYTQDDVVHVARAFTGWTMRPMQGAAFRFAPGMHDRTEKVVLGHRITAGGIGDGRAVLDILAAHPSTARHLATKLAQKFVSDTPPPALVDRAARTFLESHGDLRAVTRVIVMSAEFLSAEARGAKIKTPFEFVVSAVRATGADLRSALPLARVLRDLGQPLYFCQPPTGYDETGDTWVSSGALVARMNFALELGANRLRGVRLDTSGSLDELRDRLVADALGGSVSDTTRATLAKATTPEQVVALAIGSPEFQRQ
ncbi:MAG: DUF1800 domain-containing protein [Vicinamibacterales bacterium]